MPKHVVRFIDLIVLLVGTVLIGLGTGNWWLAIGICLVAASVKN